MFIEKLNIPTALTFDDVLLEPRESYVEPNQVDIKTKFSKHVKLNIPIVSAAMDTVSRSDLAIALARAGGISVLHRNMSAEDEAEEVRIVKRESKLIERKVRAVNSDATIAEVESFLHMHGVGGVPVVENEKIIGIVSRSDMRAFGFDKGHENIKTIMTKNPITADESITSDEAFDLMYANKVERLPIVDEHNRLLGIISMQEVLNKRQYQDAIRDTSGGLRVAASVGPFDIERAHLLEEAGADAIIVDCAHAHNMNVVKSVGEIKGSVSCDVVAGNIATAKAAEELIKHEVDGLKVGIGPGSICTTRVVAGVGVPQITAIASVAEIASPCGIPVIGDGGIRFSGDIAKAIAAGADSVMMGNLFAGTDEAPGQVVTIQGRKYKRYRGMGSLGVMSGGVSSDRYFQKKNIGKTKFVPEGVEGVTPYVGAVSDVIYQLVGGLKSAMGYTGSVTIADMHKNAAFVRISAAGYKESHPHSITITDESPNYKI